MFQISRPSTLFRLNDVDQPTLDEALDVSAATLLNAQKIRFQQQVDPDGNPWPPRARPLPRPLLIDTSSLFRSLTVLTTQQNTRVVTVDPTARNTRTGRRVIDYAKYHQLGTRRMPKRRFLGFSDQDREQVAKVFFDILRRQLLSKRPRGRG